jgi:3-oxoisoapionate kinase
MEDTGKLLYAYYGDDFTGSTDVLEALALYGLPVVLFLSVPDKRILRNFAHCRAFGIAGESRSRTPHWMNQHLPQIFSAMREWKAKVNHYKVCSTFDSGPHVGSIGRAMELGRTVFSEEVVPIVVGAPHLGRALAYGNLFAAANGQMHRIDCHPTMSRHPVTPMREADLRLHLALQTRLRIGLVDLQAFRQDRVSKSFEEQVAEGTEAMLFDGIDEPMLDETAQLLWERASQKPIFAVASSGLSYGMLRHWKRIGLIEATPELAQPAAAERLLVLSGSCSPITGRQIQTAATQGFAILHLPEHTTWEAPMQQAQQMLSCGKSVVIYTALGASDKNATYGEQFSRALGKELRKLLLSTGVRRIVMAGGDTSTHVVQQLELAALSFVAQLAPGAPLCRAHALGSPLDGLELVLKGGQVGPENFFALARDGR